MLGPEVAVQAGITSMSNNMQILAAAYSLESNQYMYVFR